MEREEVDFLVRLAQKIHEGEPVGRLFSRIQIRLCDAVPETRTPLIPILEDRFVNEITLSRTVEILQAIICDDGAYPSGRR